MAATLANAWARRGDELILLCCYSGRGSCEQQLDPAVRVLWLADFMRGPAFLQPAVKVLTLRRLIRRIRPDRVVSFLTNVNITALLATRGLDLPLVVSERTDPAHSVNLEPMLRRLRRVLYPAAYGVIVQTHQSMPHLLQVAPGVKNLLSIPNPLPEGLPPARLQEPSGGRKILMAVGRFNPVKQFGMLIRVFAAIAPQCPDWDLVIHGEGPERLPCLHLVETLGMTERIRLPGYSKSIWSEFLQAHGFVLSSRVEGFPNALLEAMALGLPCVALDCPSGPAEISRKGLDAVLVPVDDEQALTGALLELMRASPEQRNAAGQAAARSVRERFSLASVLQAWDAVWSGPESQPLEVMHVISGLHHGGAETVLLRLLAASGEGTRHTVISMGNEGVMGPRFREAGIELHALDMQGPLSSLRGLWRLYRLLRARRPDVVQTWMYHADLLAGLVTRLAGIRALSWGIRNSGVGLSLGSRSARMAAWLCARLSGCLPGVIVACAHKAVRVHARWGYKADRMLVIPNGYDLDEWHPDPVRGQAVRAGLDVPEGAFLLACVARWNPQKDHQTLFAALAQCVRAHPGLRCALIGLGMSRDNARLVEMARHYGLLDNLLFLGRRDDVPALMQAVEIHVLSSVAEGFPNVVCEAMAAGAASVVTDVGDAALIVGEHGWVVPPRDAAALASAIEQAMRTVRSPQWPAQQAAARASLAARYGVQAMVSRYETAWRRLAADFPGPARRRRFDSNRAGIMSLAQLLLPKAQAPGEDALFPDAQAAARGSILFFVTNPAFLVSHRLALVLAARDAGHEVHVASMDGPAVADLQALGLQHHVLPLSRTGMRPWAEIRSLWAIWSLMRRLRPQLVHAVTIKSVLYGGLVSRLARVPAFVAAISGLGYLFVPGGGRRGLLRRLALFLYRLAFRHPNCRVIFQNEADRDEFLRFGLLRENQPVMIRGSGVDLQQFSPAPLPAGPIVIVMASRLLRDKGVMEFAEAARLSAARGDDLCWRIAGSPDPENPASIGPAELQAWQQAGVPEYLGEVNDVASLYADAHIVALPSYREGLPKSLIEAAACARPVITTDVPGCRDALVPGETGVLVPVRDARALADAALELARDEDLRIRMGAAGRKLAESEFDLHKIVREHMQLYEALLHGRSPGAAVEPDVPTQ